MAPAEHPEEWQKKKMIWHATIEYIYRAAAQKSEQPGTGQWNTLLMAELSNLEADRGCRTRCLRTALVAADLLPLSESIRRPAFNNRRPLLFKMPILLRNS